jgi:hypothetical protein
MTAPSLDALRDIHLPPAPALATVDWWLVTAAVMLLAAVGWAMHHFVRRHHLRMALSELRRLTAAYAHDGDATRLATGLSRLLRRHAMTLFPQADVAGLTGTAWLHFLDTHGGDSAFCDGIGAVLETRPYQSGGAYDEAALIALVRRWLEANP